MSGTEVEPYVHASLYLVGAVAFFYCRSCETCPKERRYYIVFTAVLLGLSVTHFTQALL